MVPDDLVEGLAESGAGEAFGWGIISWGRLGGSGQGDEQDQRQYQETAAQEESVTDKRQLGK
jgi:hypothetical protein